MKRVIIVEDSHLYCNGIRKNAEGKFNQSIRSISYGDPLELGDVIHIPEEYEIFDMIIDPNRLDSTGNPISTPFVTVDAVNIFSGIVKRVRFFPNQLVKTIFPVDEKGKRLPKVRTLGTASSYYITFKDVDEGMNAIKGLKIRVKRKTSYKTIRFGDNQIVSEDIYEYDLEESRYKTIKGSIDVLKLNDTKTGIIGVQNIQLEDVERIIIPDDIFKIEKCAFSGCKNLCAIYLNKVHEIHKYAFSDCISLKRIDIPWTTTYIDSRAFVGCSSLEEINVPDDFGVDSEYSVQDYYPDGYVSIDGILYDRYKNGRELTLRIVPPNYRQSHLVLPSKVTRIGYGSFAGCQKLQTVTLPNGLEECPGSVFCDCNLLERIYIPKYTFSRFAKILPNYQHLLAELET